MSLIVENIKQFAAITADKQREYYTFILEHGKVYQNVSNEAYEFCFTPIAKGCFGNSLLGNLYHGLDYIEGYYITENIPLALDHAFNLDESWNVLDSTAMAFDIPVEEYFGVKIPDEVLRDYFDYMDGESDWYVTALQYYWRHYICNN